MRFRVYCGVLFLAIVKFSQVLGTESQASRTQTPADVLSVMERGNLTRTSEQLPGTVSTVKSYVEEATKTPASIWDQWISDDSGTSSGTTASGVSDDATDWYWRHAANETEPDADEELPLKYTMIALAYSLVVLVSLVGNLFVVLVIISKKRTRTTVNIFIANLAVSDLLMTVLNIPFTAARWLMDNWVFGSFLCHVTPFIQATSVYVSTLTMCFIAVDRFQAILQPMRRRVSTRIATSHAIALIWMIAMLFSLPFLFFNRVKVHVGIFGKIYTRCKVVYPEPEFLYTRIINVITFILQFGIPFTIMVSLYSRIGVKIWSRTTIGATTREQEDRQFNAKKRTIIMLLLVAIVFAFCWFPHNLYHFLVDFKFWNTDLNTAVFIHWLAMSSVCYNPFIYFWLNRRFQQILRAGMRRFCSNCYCHPDSTGCSCMGITCFCHKMTATKMAHVSSPTSETSPRRPKENNNNAGNCARGGQAYRLHHNNWKEERNDVRKLTDSNEEKDTGFNDPGLPAQETLSQYTQEDVILHSPRKNGCLRDAGSSGGSAGSSEASAARDVHGRDMGENTNSPSSGSACSRKAHHSRKHCHQGKDLNTVSSSIEGKSLFRNRNLHQEQWGKNCNPTAWNQSKLNNMTRRIFMDSKSRNSLSSSSSVGSGLDHHQKHLICHYRGIRRRVNENHHPMYQTRCDHKSVSRCVKKEQSIVLTSL